MMKNNNLLFPEVKALQNQPHKLMVLIHGLGSDGHDLIGIVPFIQPNFPDCHFISPHGVEPYDLAPFGRQWFSVADRTPEVIIKLVARNVVLLESIIKHKQVELNLTNQETIIVGFSQGTMIGLYLNLIQEEPFHSMIGFSGMLIPPPRCINKVTPICLVHGEEDEIVRVDEMEIAAQYLANQNIKYKTYNIPYLAHTIDAKGMEIAVNFIKNKGEL